MSIRVKDVDGHRCLQVDAHNEGCPNSVFISGARGFCFEVEKDVLIRAMKLELDLMEPLTVEIERFLAAV